MTVHIFRTRMAMRGEYYSYDVLIPVSEIDETKHSYFVQRDGCRYINYPSGTLPDSHHTMPLGWDRYEAFKAHEKAAETAAWELVRKAFPEIGDRPKASLWLEIPGFDKRHAKRELVA